MHHPADFAPRRADEHLVFLDQLRGVGDPPRLSFSRSTLLPTPTATPPSWSNFLPFRRQASHRAGCFSRWPTAGWACRFFLSSAVFAFISATGVRATPAGVRSSSAASSASIRPTCSRCFFFALVFPVSRLAFASRRTYHATSVVLHHPPHADTQLRPRLDHPDQRLVLDDRGGDAALRHLPAPARAGPTHRLEPLPPVVTLVLEIGLESAPLPLPARRRLARPSEQGSVRLLVFVGHRRAHRGRLAGAPAGLPQPHSTRPDTARLRRTACLLLHPRHLRLSLRRARCSPADLRAMDEPPGDVAWSAGFLHLPDQFTHLRFAGARQLQPLPPARAFSRGAARLVRAGLDAASARASRAWSSWNGRSLLLLAWCFYRLVELRSIAWGKRRAARETPNTAGAAVATLL